MFYVTRWLYYILNHMNHLNYLKLKNCFLFFKFPITNICHVPRASHKSSDYVVFRAHCWNWKYWIFESQKYSKLLKNVEKERAAPRARSSRGNELCHSDEHFPRSSRSATIFTKGKEGSFAWSSASWAKVGGQETAKQRDGRDVPMQERRSPYTLRKILIEILNLRRQSWILWNIFSFLFRCVKWFFHKIKHIYYEENFVENIF